MSGALSVLESALASPEGEAIASRMGEVLDESFVTTKQAYEWVKAQWTKPVVRKAVTVLLEGAGFTVGSDVAADVTGGGNKNGGNNHMRDNGLNSTTGWSGNKPEPSVNTSTEALERVARLAEVVGLQNIIQFKRDLAAVTPDDVMLYQIARRAVRGY